MPTPIAWLATFIFINITWIFFRANSWNEAKAILVGMIDINSAHELSIAEIPTTSLAWGGVFSDKLLAILPAGVAVNFVCYLMIVVAFFIIAQRNSYEIMMQNGLGWKKMFATVILFSIPMYAAIHTTSTVFLYFNF